MTAYGRLTAQAVTKSLGSPDIHWPTACLFVSVIMHETHRQAAESHELSAQSHRSASEQNEKGDQEAGNWHVKRAAEHADRAYELAKAAHNKSDRIETLP